MKEFFKPWRPGKRAKQIISMVEEICAEYEGLGYRLTTRQAYYRLVGRNAIRNTVNEYHSVGYFIDRGKQAGLLDWEMFEDRARTVEGDVSKPYHGALKVDIPAAVTREVEICFQSDYWANQPYYAEIFIEKSALAEIIGRVADELGIAYTAVRGFSSGQVLKEAADRFREKAKDGRTGVLLYVGDCDPSGVVMSEDIQRRLLRFGSNAEVKRIALNINQVQQFGLPENPVKNTDTRSAAYIGKYGNGCWEVDALEPRTLADIVRAGIMEYFDEDIRKANLDEKKKYENEVMGKYRELLNKINEIAS
jgi:hypothetical protein